MLVSRVIPEILLYLKALKLSRNTRSLLACELAHLGFKMKVTLGCGVKCHIFVQGKLVGAFVLHGRV